MAENVQTIDRLQVEIEATVKGTATVFKTLEVNLKSLQTALNSIDTSKIKALQKVVNATKVKPDTSGMSKAESEVKASVEKIQRAIAGLEAYANKSMNGDKSAFTSFERGSTSAQSELDKLKTKLEQIGNVAAPTKAFEKVNKEIEETNAHLESLKAKEREAMDSGGHSDYEMLQLAFAIQEADAHLKDLNAEADRLVSENKAFYDPFKSFRDSVESAQGKLNDMQKQVGAAMEEISNAQPSTSGIDNFIAKLQNEIPASISKIEQDFAGLGAYANAALSGDKSAFTSFERRITSIQSAIDVVVNKLTQLEGAGVSSEGLETYRQSLQNIQTQLSDTASAVRAAYAEMNQAPAPEVHKEAEKASSSMRSLASSKIGLEGLNKALHKIGSSLKGISAHGLNVGKMFKTILKYGFGIRSLYVLFRRLRKAVIESFGELQNSGAFFETTKANVEALKTSLLTLKYQFGAAFEPIFNAVAPAIKVLIDYLVDAMNALSAFMARLTGKSTYSKVKWVNTAADQAAKSVKALNKQLQQFDELNNLTTSNSGGSGGSGDATKAVYEEASVDSALGNFGKNLADLIRAGEWEEVGKTISDKLAEQLEGINWNEIKGKAGKFGKNLADFLNGLINPRLFADIGTTIGEAINTGLTFFNEWGKGMEWENLGSSLASGFNAWLKAGNLPLLGETLHTWLAGGLDALITFIDETDFEELGKQLGEFIANLNIPDLVGKLATLAKKILIALADAIKGLWNNGDITTRFGIALVAIIGGAKLIGLTNIIGGLIGSALSGQTVTATATGFTLKLAGVALAVSGAMTLGALALGEQAENNIFDPNSTTRGHDIAVRGGQYALGLGATALAGGTLAKLITGANFLPAALGIAKTAAPLLIADILGSELGNQIGKDFFGTVLNDKEMASYYKEYEGFGNIFDIDTYRGLGEIFGAITDGTLGKAWNELWGDVGEFFYDFHQENRQALEEWLGFTKGVENTETSMKGAWDGVSEKINQTTNAYKGLGNATSVAGNKTKELVSHTQKFGDESSKSTNKFKSAISGLPDTVQNIFSKAYTDGTNTWNGLGGWASQKVSEVSNGVSPLTSKTSETFGNAYNQSTSRWNGLKEWASGVFSNVNTQASEKLGKVPTHFNKSFQEGTTSAKSHLSSFNTWFQALNLEKKAGVKADEPSFNKVKATYDNLIRNFKNHTATINVEGKGFSEIGNQIDNLVNKLRNAQSLKSGLTNSYSSYGSYSNLRYFASGGIVSGAMQAVVGEKGPEAILPLTDNTLGSLAHLIVGEMATPQMASVNSNIGGYYGSDSNAVAEQNALLREEIQILRQIASKELTVSSKDVFDATRNESNNYYNRTGNSPFLF